jgi:hypothetical protein
MKKTSSKGFTGKEASEAGRALGHPEELTRAQERSLGGSILSRLPRQEKRHTPRGGSRRSGR